MNLYQILIIDADGKHWLRKLADWDEYRYIWTRDEIEAGVFSARDSFMIEKLMALNPLVISCVRIKM